MILYEYKSKCKRLLGKTAVIRYAKVLSDKGPSLEMLDVAFGISAVQVLVKAALTQESQSIPDV